MADTPSALTEQVMQNAQEIAAQNQAMAAQMQQNQEHFFASQMARSQEIDDAINGMAPGGAALAPAFDHGPMMEGPPGAPMNIETMPMIDGQTPGLVVQQSMHHQDDSDGGGIIESLLGFDLDGDEQDGADIDDAIQLAQETGQVVVIEEVIVIDPNGGEGSDASSGDFAF